MENIGQRIRNYRRRQNLTQGKLAEYLGVTDQAVSKWERGTAVPDIALLVPLTRLLGCTADELLGIRMPQNEEQRAFEERVERIIKEERSDLPPTFDFRKAADYLQNDWFKSPAFSGQEIDDALIRNSVAWLMEIDEHGGEWVDPLGSYALNYQDFCESLCERALAGDRDALDLFAVLEPTEQRREGYRRVFALCHVLGATEIVNIGCGPVPYVGMLLQHTGFRYTGISAAGIEEGGPERFNRLLRDYAPDVRFLPAKWPDCEIEVGEEAIGLMFLCHTHDEEPEKCFGALSRQFSRAVVQVNDAEQETAFRRAFSGFQVRILWEQRHLGRFSGVERFRQALYFVTKFREDIALLDEIEYEWGDARFYDGDVHFESSYYERWRKAIQESGAAKEEVERRERAYRMANHLRDNLASICARDDEERRILETQQGVRADSLLDRTVGGARLTTAYRAEGNPERLIRGGDGDYLLAGGTEEFEGTTYEFAVYAMDGLARTFECREAHPERDPDPYDPGLPFRREKTENTLRWLRNVGKEKWERI
ncbi:MAG: helix-turn-helix domain-containing protein [Clostridiales bacterium]|nr:helix-turn-helix domain-containing protein [Clostridiales bacterium]